MALVFTAPVHVPAACRCSGAGLLRVWLGSACGAVLLAPMFPILIVFLRPVGLRLLLLLDDTSLVQGILCPIEGDPPRVRLIRECGPHLRESGVLSVAVASSVVAASRRHREPKVMPATERIFYGKDLTQFGDLRIPKGSGPFPVAIIVHGGAWGSAVALHYTSALAAALTCAGFATWNYEYRRIGGGGGWPQTYHDVGNGADFIRELIGLEAGEMPAAN